MTILLSYFVTRIKETVKVRISLCKSWNYDAL